MFAASLPRAMHTVAGAAVIYAAGSSPFLLYRLPHLRARKQAFPIATVVVLAGTAIVTGLQLIYPEVLNALRRNPSALSAGEWWRLITPIFVQADGWPQIMFNFTGIALVGPVVERIYGSRRWLVLYFVPALAGEIAGYAWSPYGAGSSLALAGLVGSLFAWLLWPNRQLPVVTRLLGALGLTGAVALALLRDIHGPPVIAGACIAALMLWRDSREPDVPPVMVHTGRGGRRSDEEPA